MRGRLLGASIVLLIVPHARAGELHVHVADARGAAVADAVVTAEARGNVDMSTSHAPATKVIDQKNETFLPYIEIFHPGDKVVFHNSDRTRHHVYTFAPARQFEFVLAPGQSSDPIELDHPGSIAVGCNIHDGMITYLYVSAAPWIARTDKDGNATLDLPRGDFGVRAWHPQLRPGQPDDVQIVSAAQGDSRSASFALTLLPDPRRPVDRERAAY